MIEALEWLAYAWHPHVMTHSLALLFTKLTPPPPAPRPLHTHRRFYDKLTQDGAAQAALGVDLAASPWYGADGGLDCTVLASFIGSLPSVPAKAYKRFSNANPRCSLAVSLRWYVPRRTRSGSTSF